jgi:hypothetical protein
VVQDDSAYLWGGWTFNLYPYELEPWEKWKRPAKRPFTDLLMTVHARHMVPSFVLSI